MVNIKCVLLIHCLYARGTKASSANISHIGQNNFQSYICINCNVVSQNIQLLTFFLDWVCVAPTPPCRCLSSCMMHKSIEKKTSLILSFCMLLQILSWLDICTDISTFNVVKMTTSMLFVTKAWQVAPLKIFLEIQILKYLCQPSPLRLSLFVSM